MTPIAKFTVVRDGEGWGVADETGTLINDAPMGKAEAKQLALKCNQPHPQYADENDRAESGYWGE